MSYACINVCVRVRMHFMQYAQIARFAGMSQVVQNLSYGHSQLIACMHDLNHVLAILHSSQKEERKNQLLTISNSSNLKEVYSL